MGKQCVGGAYIVVQYFHIVAIRAVPDGQKIPVALAVAHDSHVLPIDPGRADGMGNGNFISVLVSGGHAAVDYMGGPLGAHVILVIVGGQNSVHMLEGKGIKHKGHVAQVGLPE